MHLHLIRHTHVQAEGLCYGRHDPPLAASFETEVQALAARMADLPTMPIYCSPALRCRRLAENLGLQPHYDDRLQELHFGTWEGRLWSDIPRTESDIWTANFVHQAPPNGESYATLQARVLDFLQDLHASGTTQAAIISHAGVIRACLAHVQRIPLEQSFSQITVGYGDIIRIEIPHSEAIAA